jgi:hypothetical protein
MQTSWNVPATLRQEQVCVPKVHGGVPWTQGSPVFGFPMQLGEKQFQFVAPAAGQLHVVVPYLHEMPCSPVHALAFAGWVAGHEEQAHARVVPMFLQLHWTAP